MRVLPKPCIPPCSPSSHSQPSAATDLTLLETAEEQVCDLKQLHDDPQVSIQEESTAIPFSPKAVSMGLIVSPVGWSCRLHQIGHDLWCAPPSHCVHLSDTPCWSSVWPFLRFEQVAEARMQARQSHKERLCLTYLARADIVPDFPPVKKVSGLVDEVHFLSFSTPPSGLVSHACLLLPTQSLVHSCPVFLFCL